MRGGPPELELWVEGDAEAVLVGVEVDVAVLGERLVDEGLAKVGDELGRILSAEFDGFG